MSTLASELGIGKTQARAYVQELERQSFIAVDRENRHFASSGAGGSNRYVFLWHVAFEGEKGKSRKIPPLRKTGRVPLQRTEPLPLQKTGGEENHHQDSQGKENQQTKSLAGEPGKSVGDAESTKPANSFSVDGENLSELPIGGSAWEKLLGEFRTANRGAEMSFQDECWLKEQMELRGVTPEALLRLVNDNPLGGFHSPMAAVKWLVKKFGNKTRSSRELEAANRLAAGTLSPPIEAPRCDRCSNTGRVLDRTEAQRATATEQYCDCRMGKELEAVERRIRTPPRACLTRSRNSSEGLFG